MIRIGTEKVRTGCFTCKRRRVKCDEGRPECQRCIKAGRTCEGYAGSSTPGKFIHYGHGSTNTKSHTGDSTPTSRAQSRTPSPPAWLTSYPDLDNLERRALAHFQDRTAWELAGAFPPEFWLRSILPIAQHESSIKHALIALSSMHEQFIESGRMSPNTNATTIDFALNHYGRAIREVVRLNQNQREHSYDSALITCGIFSAFESIQGHYHSAFSHAVSGIKILVEEQNNTQSPLLPGDSNIYVPRTELNHFFISFWRQIFELGDFNFQGERPDLRAIQQPIPNVFSSTYEALAHMELNMANLFHSLERAARIGASGAMTPQAELALQLEMQSIKDRFDMCSRSYKAMPPPSPNKPVRKDPAGLILDMYQTIMRVYLGFIEENNDDESFDKYHPEMRTAVDLAEEFVLMTSSFPGASRSPSPNDRNSPSQASSSEKIQQLYGRAKPTFSMSLGIVPLLFLVATRCLEPTTRDKALHLLRTCNRKEGFWDSQLTTRLVERTAEIKATALAKLNADSAALAATRGLPTSRTFGEVDVKLKLENIAYYPESQCELQYSIMWMEEGGGGKIGAFGGHLGQPTMMIRKQDYSERLKWAEPAYVEGHTPPSDAITPGLISDEVRPGLEAWERHGVLR